MSLSYQYLGSQSIVSGLIWNLYGYQIPSDAVWGVPVAFDPTLEDAYQRDTTLVITMPVTDLVYTGPATLTYSRIDLGTLVPASANVITMPDVPFSTYDILTQINTVYALGLTEDDVQDVQYINDQGPFNLIAKPGSLAWKNTLALTVNLSDLTPLTLAIPVVAVGSLTAS